MTGKPDIESRLDRSLANQVKAPRLSRSFDAAVWARIEAEAQAATNPVSAQSRSTPALWLVISNAIGVSVTVLLVLVFGIQSLSDASIEMPALSISPALSEQILGYAGPVITIVSLGFGLMFTRFGRWVRDVLI